MWFFEPFKEDIKPLNLFGWYLAFFISGILIQELLLPLSPMFTETEKEMVGTLCEPINILLIIAAPITESLLMILPFKYLKKWKFVGMFIWILFHLTLNIPYFLYICIMSIFYIKALKSKKYKWMVIFHGLVNWIGVLACL